MGDKRERSLRGTTGGGEGRPIEAGKARRLGIDIGGTKVVLALSAPTGELASHTRLAFPRRGDAERDLEAIADAARAFLRAEGCSEADVSAVGVALPGPLDVEAGRVLSPPNLPGWGSVPVRDLLSEAFGVPVHLENDANAAALAEWRLGAGRGSARMVYLTMSTGVGGGLVLEGRLYRGAFSSAGEVGHMPVEWDGLPCACGQRGCLEAYIGGASLERRLRAETPGSSALVRMAGSRGAITPRDWLDAARAGDAYALSELDRFNTYLARAIAQLAYVLSPDCVVLGTIAVAAGDALCFEPLRSKLRPLLWGFLADHLKVVPAALGGDLPAHAALCAAELADTDGAVPV